MKIIGSLNSLQGRIVEVEYVLNNLWGKGKVEVVMVELRGTSTCSIEEYVGWLDNFSKFYWKDICLHIVLEDIIE